MHVLALILVSGFLQLPAAPDPHSDVSAVVESINRRSAYFRDARVDCLPKAAAVATHWTETYGASAWVVAVQNLATGQGHAVAVLACAGQRLWVYDPAGDRLLPARATNPTIAFDFGPIAEAEAPRRVAVMRDPIRTETGYAFAENTRWEVTRAGSRLSAGAFRVVPAGVPLGEVAR